MSDKSRPALPRLGRRWTILIVAGMAVLAVAAGASYASRKIAAKGIPDANGVIHGCFKNNGDLRVVKKNTACKNNETSLSWNQTGPRGAAGPPGAAGPAGAPGSRGDKGATGAQGPKGDTGSSGSKGDKGATGAQGPKGATGVAGANGVSGYQLVSTAVTTLPNGGATASGAAFCPTGKKVVGGGWDTDASKNVFVIQSTPNASGSAWLGTIQNNSTGSVQVVLTAACVTAPTTGPVPAPGPSSTHGVLKVTAG